MSASRLLHSAGLTMHGVPGGLAQLTMPVAAAAAAAGRMGFHQLSGGHCVMLVSNLNPEVSPSMTPSRPVVAQMG